MSDRFEICHPITATWEGGWSNHKADPGGATMYGVTQAVYSEWRAKRGLSKASVRYISKSEALSVYRERYWLACGADKLFPGVDLAVYDASVNSGVSRGVKWLKASAGSNDHSVTVKRICRARLGFMQSLKIWKTFGKGWGRRVADIEARGVVMALTAMGVTKSSIDHVTKTETAAATKSAKANDTAAKTTGAGAGASAGTPAAVDASQLDTAALWMLGAFVLVLAVATIVLIARSRAAKARAAAYQGVAQ